MLIYARSRVTRVSVIGCDDVT